MRRRGILLILLLACAPTVFAQSDATSERGFSAEKAFQVGEIDHVNLFNGNLVLTIPIGPSFPLSTNLSYGLTLSYNANLWDFDHYCDDGDPEDRCVTVATPAPGFTAGAGWNLSMGRLLRPNTDISAASRWAYHGGDGSSHTFYRTLHTGDPDENPAQPPGEIDPDLLEVGYSRDGSYLRMRKLAVDRRVIEFPDGTVQEFKDPGIPGPPADEWLLTRYTDRFGNMVEVQYLPNEDDWDTWRLVDSHGREQRVIFERTPQYDFHAKRVKQVEFEAFGTQAEAVWTFAYNEAELARGCPHNDSSVSSHVTVPLLASITLPDGSNYSMQEYANGTGNCSSSSGGIRKLRLPTRGVLEWTYGGYVYPYREITYPPGVPPAPRPPMSVGVKERILFRPDGSELGRWTYDPQLTGEPNPHLANEMTNTVTDPFGHKTVHYFSVDRDGIDFSGDWTQFDYGLPYSRNHTVDGLFLSTQVFEAGETDPIRSTYLRYERDARDPPPTDGSEDMLAGWNRRVAHQRTVFHDDQDTYVETVRSNFDGLGHYREEIRRGAGVGYDGMPSKTTHVEHNPDVGEYRVDPVTGHTLAGFTMLTSADPWVLNTSTFMEERQGGQFFRTESTYDPETRLFGMPETVGVRWPAQQSGCPGGLRGFRDLGRRQCRCRAHVRRRLASHLHRRGLFTGGGLRRVSR